MRRHAAHAPHASNGIASAALGSDCLGERQFSACATATAVRRVPAPAGPAKMRLGGSVPRETDRDRIWTLRRSVAMSRNGIDTAMLSRLFPALFLRRRAVVLLVVVLADPKEARPEASLFLRCLWRID